MKRKWNPAQGLEEIKASDIRGGDEIVVVTDLNNRTQATLGTLVSVGTDGLEYYIEDVNGKRYFAPRESTKFYLLHRPVIEPTKLGAVIAGKQHHGSREYWVRGYRKHDAPWLQNNTGRAWSWEDIVNSCETRVEIVSDGVLT